MVKKRCFCGTIFNNIILYENHHKKCKLKTEDKFKYLNLYIDSLLNKSSSLKNKLLIN